VAGGFTTGELNRFAVFVFELAVQRVEWRGARLL
jgi:hypothetical protein